MLAFGRLFSAIELLDSDRAVGALLVPPDVTVNVVAGGTVAVPPAVSLNAQFEMLFTVVRICATVPDTDARFRAPSSLLLLNATAEFAKAVGRADSLVPDGFACHAPLALIPAT